MLLQVTKIFTPEFLNRIDEILVFLPLTRQEIRRIVELRLAELNARLADQGLTISCSDELKNLLAVKGYDTVYGARPLKRAIMKLVDTPLAEALLAGRFQKGDDIRVRLHGDNVIFEKGDVGKSEHSKAA